MNQERELDAYQVVNSYSQSQLTDALYQYGNEEFSRQIAHRIVQRWQQELTETTFKLVELIEEAVSVAKRRTSGHPTKKSFQAIRVKVNHELDSLRTSLQEAIELLKPGKRISVITFQSREDKIVKKILKENSEVGVPRGIPVIPDNLKPKLKLVDRKPTLATVSELINNNRLHSAKLRMTGKL